MVPPYTRKAVTGSVPSCSGRCPSGSVDVRGRVGMGTQGTGRDSNASVSNIEPLIAVEPASTWCPLRPKFADRRDV
jgi:hypothetical protein